MKKLLFVVVLLLAGIHPASGIGETLPSWHDGAAKTAIVEFVSAVTTPGNSDFLPERERIAVFDNDGCLWSEKPAYFQLFFAIDRVRALADKHPEWKEKQPFKDVLEDNMEGLAASGEKGLLELIMATHAGMTSDEFSSVVLDWVNTARHPVSGKFYTDMVFQPMLELLDYLRAHQFKTFIVSGGGIEFMRPWVEGVYGIPPEQVVGSSVVTSFEMRDGNPVLVREAKINFIDDKAGKPVGIHQHIGRQPVFAFGNSDGDLQMLQWTTLRGEGRRFAGIVHHTDADREFAYDRDSHVGRLDKALSEAAVNGWTVVDMKKDWKVVYP